MSRVGGRKRSAVTAAAGLAAALATAPGAADVAPDTGLADRQALALARVAAVLVPLRNYDAAGDRSDCVAMGADGPGLVAQLELDRRGLPGGTTPAEAAPWALHLAAAITRLVGTGGAQERCHWSVAGAPAPAQATANLAYALHRYGGDWPAEVEEAIRAAAEDASWQVYPCVANGNIDIPAARLLVGEALGLPGLVDLGLADLRAMADSTMRSGLCEPNAPLYTAEHFPPLVYLQALANPRGRTLGRILLEYELLFQAHSYLPGGALGAPQMRDYAGGAFYEGEDYLPVVLWLLVGDPAVATPEDHYLFAVAAATEYVVPEIIRSLFLDKGPGYSSWTYTFAQQGSGRTPEAVYPLGLDGAQAIPWQTVMLADGAASLGVSYGYRRADLYVSSGAYVRAPGGEFAILYQYQPAVCGDTDDEGGVYGCGGSSVNEDPDDFTGELYDFERLVYGHSAISLWDPTARPDVVRTYPDTRVHVPKLDALGGEARQAGDWYVGRLGNVYLGYRPLGTIAAEEDRGDFTYLRLAGRSGGITEIGTAADFADLATFAASLEARHAAFEAEPLAAEFDAWDSATHATVRVRLEYRPERRVVDGAEVPVSQALGHGLLESPWAAWTAETRQLRVARDCYAPLSYDFDDETIEEQEPAPACGGSGGAGGSAAGGGGATPPAANGDDAAADGSCGCRAVGQPRRRAAPLGAGLAAAALARGRRRRAFSRRV